METIEGNKLIAEFMRYHKWEDGTYSIPDPVLSHNFDEFNMRFHCSWDWLMPVISEITLRSSNVSFESKWGRPNGNCGMVHFCHITGNTGVVERPQSIYRYSNDSLIYAVWVAVIEFIEAHNKTIW